VVSRALEAGGLATTSISLVREHTVKIKPPRALWVPFPFGSALGRPNDRDLQRRVIQAALDLLPAPAGPILRDFSYGEPDEGPPAPLQASAVAVSAPAFDAAMETTQMRRYHEQWLARTGATAVGLTGIPPARFRGVIRFLEAFAEGRPAELRERPPDVPLPVFLRRCADDLKAMYYEARMVARPGTSSEEIARWFWGETATGALVRRVRERMDASDDPALRAAGFGIAR